MNAEGISQRDRFATFGRIHVHSALGMYNAARSWILRYAQDDSTVLFEVLTTYSMTLGNTASTLDLASQKKYFVEREYTKEKQSYDRCRWSASTRYEAEW